MKLVVAIEYEPNRPGAWHGPGHELDRGEIAMSDLALILEGVPGFTNACVWTLDDFAEDISERAWQEVLARAFEA